MGIFSEFAPKYWAAGIPVMPLKKMSKIPILNEWGQYGKVMPSQAIQDMWVESYPDCNIGLPFGPASGLCAIDIDTVDEEMVEAIMDCLPMSPWTRIGKKGCGLIFRWQGQKNFKIGTKDGMLCEFLGMGNQLVMPPSIHPDTRMPYTSNTDLWEVMEKIPQLGVDIEERLRKALGVKGVSLAHDGRSAPLAVVPQGERDIQMVRQAGYFARVVLGIDKSAKFPLADAMAQMHQWVVEYTGRASGDDMDPQKGVAKLLEFLMKDVEGGKTMPNGWDTGLTAEQREHPSIAALGVQNEVARWTVSKACKWLDDQVALNSDDNDWAIAQVYELISKVAADDNFNEFEFSILANDLNRNLGVMKQNKSVLLKAFKTARANNAETSVDHESIAREVIEEIERGGELRHAQGRFWQWNGSCFGVLEDDGVYRTIAESIKGNMLSRRHNDYAALVKAVAILARKDLIENLEPGINFANGFLDINGVLHEHSPKFGRTFTMPFNYVPERANEAHKWLEYLELSWGDDHDYEDKVKALQEAFAATMYGMGPDYQRAILLFGKAGSGKTQALEVLQALMPPAAVCSISPVIWGRQFALAGMVGKSLNVCGELPESGAIEGDHFKLIVGGEPQSSEFKGKDSFMFRPLATHWFGSNYIPKSKDSTEGFLRRWLIFEFNRVVKQEERIKNFYLTLVAEEREAIAAWAVQGMARLVKNNDYTLPPSHEVLINQVRRSNNSIAAWLESCTKIRPLEGATCDAREAFDQYTFYTKEVSRGWPVGFEGFRQMIRELGYKEHKNEGEDGVIRYVLNGLVSKTLGSDKKWDKIVQ